MSVAVKTTYVEEGLGLLRQAFKGRPLITATLTAFLQHAQQIENASQQLVGTYDVAGATGATLDGIGSIAGVSRNGLDDESYRLLIYAQIAANSGDAALNTVLAVARKLFQSGAVFGKTALSAPGAGGQNAYISLTIPRPKLPARLYAIAQRLLANNLGAGVTLGYLATYSAQNVFACKGGSSTGGFASADGSISGAPLAGLLTNQSGS